jgi:hypothetical protein
MGDTGRRLGVRDRCELAEFRGSCRSDTRRSSREDDGGDRRGCGSQRRADGDGAASTDVTTSPVHAARR